MRAVEIGDVLIDETAQVGRVTGVPQIATASETDGLTSLPATFGTMRRAARCSTVDLVG